MAILEKRVILITLTVSKQIGLLCILLYMVDYVNIIILWRRMDSCNGRNENKFDNILIKLYCSLPIQFYLARKKNDSIAVDWVQTKDVQITLMHKCKYKRVWNTIFCQTCYQYWALLTTNT